VSTDEVYGSVDEGHSREDDPLRPRSPYAAAKAAGELLVRSYVVTHGLDAVVTRGSNTYGPYHHPEKLIPLFVTNAIDDQPLPLYGDGLQRRDWLYVADHAGSDRPRASPRRERRDLQHRRAGRDGEPRRSSAAPRALGKPWSLSVTSRTGPGTTDATRWTGRSLPRWLAPATLVRGGLAADRATGLAPTSRGGEHARSGDWDAYYERQYGSRLRSAG
jgi:dTDP-glucose 4,6-dehydratase